MLAINTIFIDIVPRGAAYYLTKGSNEISASPLKDFLSKGSKSAKNA